MIKLEREGCPNPDALTNDYTYRENKEALLRSTFYKCMYCESKILHIDYGDIEHIKPKSKFPQFKYDWENLGIACVKCNRENKKDLYHPDFIDPFQDDPEDHILAAGGIIIPKNGSNRGQITIDLVNLNRPDLLEKRYTELMKIQRLLERYHSLNNPIQKEALMEQIIEEASRDKEYSLAKKFLINANFN